jgi:hypothetical protein
MSISNFLHAGCMLSTAHHPGIHHPNNVSDEVSTVMIEAENFFDTLACIY